RWAGLEGRPYTISADPRLGTLLHQLETLHHSESVLLVHDHKAKFGEVDFLLDQRMGSDNQLGVSLRDMPTGFAFAIIFKRSGEQNNAVPRRLQNPPRRKIMLLRQDFCRRHQRDLIPILNSNDPGFEGHQGLSRTHIALQKPPHWRRLLHVPGNFLQRALLRSRRMEWQDSLDCFANFLVQLKSNSGLRLLLATL